MPTSGSPIRSCIAPKATTIGKVAGAGSPVRYGVPVAAANAVTASSVTSYGAVGGEGRPARDASTAMPGTLAAARPDPERNDARPEHRTGVERVVVSTGSTDDVAVSTGSTDDSAGLAVRRMGAAARAELLQLHAVGVVAPVLLGDVVALLAHGARERDLGANVGALAGHGESFGRSCCRSGRPSGRPSVVNCVVGAGFEPATPRL